MRETFRAAPECLTDDLARAAGLAGQMMTQASTALSQADLGLAQLVIASRGELRALCDSMDQRCATLLALQAPVATDLRMVIAAMRVVGDVERMGTILFAKDWSHGVEPAVDTALIGRYYERFADHAVAIARQVSFLATGLAPER